MFPKRFIGILIRIAGMRESHLYASNLIHNQVYKLIKEINTFQI